MRKATMHAHRPLVNLALVAGVAAGTLAGLVVAPGRAEAQAIVIKLGTLAPKGSTWETLLKEMGQEWSKLSNGQVTLRIYAGGTLGNEGDMVKKMRVGQLQAAALTSIGLHDVSPEPQAIDVPMMIESPAMLDYVRERVAPKMEKAIEQKGFVVLDWSEVGFVRFFSTKRFDSIKALQENAKVFCWEGDPASADAWRAGGFKPVIMSSTDIVPSLQTGLLDTVALSPLYAYTSQIFQKAKFMIDTPWASLTGAMVVRKDVWDKIPADLRPKLVAVAHETGKKIDAEVRRMDAEALKSMQAQGLTIVKGDPAQLYDAAKAAWKVIRGRVVPEPMFDEIQKLAAEAKAQKK
jgi:TRAP-type C4-dicarboxylate transport system substrate-binding protein